MPALPQTNWPGEALESLGDGWYKFNFSQVVETANIIFNGSAGQTLDLILEPATPCYQNNSWVSLDLCEIEDKKAPIISASPAAGNYEQLSLTIDLIAQDRDPNAAIYYTQDGVDSMSLVVISGDATFTGLPNGKWVDLVTGDTQLGTTVNASAQGQGNIRVYVLNGEKIEGLNGDYIK